MGRVTKTTLPWNNADNIQQSTSDDEKHVDAKEHAWIHDIPLITSGSARFLLVRKTSVLLACIQQGRQQLFLYVSFTDVDTDVDDAIDIDFNTDIDFNIGVDIDIDFNIDIDDINIDIDIDFDIKIYGLRANTQTLRPRQQMPPNVDTCKVLYLSK